MSPGAVRTLQAMFAELNRGGVDAISPAFVERYFDADVVWQSAGGDARPLRGRAQVLEQLRSWGLAMDAFRSEPEEIIDAGELIVAVHHAHGVMRGSNAELDVRYASVSLVRDRVIVSRRQYRRLEEALAAAGQDPLHREHGSG